MNASIHVRGHKAAVAALTAVAFAFGTTAAISAQFSVGPFQGDTAITRLTMRGRDLASDSTAFKAIAARLSAAPAGQSRQRVVVDLEGLGGDFDTAIAIGRIIHRDGFETYVRDDGVCLSACALIWLSGAIRHMSETAHIGFHQPYDEKTLTTPPEASARVTRYASNLGLPENVSRFVNSKTLGTGLAWLTPEIAAKIGLPVTIEAANPATAHPVSQEIIDAIDRAKAILRLKGQVALFADLSSCYGALAQNPSLATAYLCFAAELATRQALQNPDPVALSENAVFLDSTTTAFISQESIRTRTIDSLMSLGLNRPRALDVLRHWIDLNNATVAHSD